VTATSDALRWFHEEIGLRHSLVLSPEKMALSDPLIELAYQSWLRCQACQNRSSSEVQCSGGIGVDVAATRLYQVVTLGPAECQHQSDALVKKALTTSHRGFSGRTMLGLLYELAKGVLTKLPDGANPELVAQNSHLIAHFEPTLLPSSSAAARNGEETSNAASATSAEKSRTFHSHPYSTEQAPNSGPVTNLPKGINPYLTGNEVVAPSGPYTNLPPTPNTGSQQGEVSSEVAMIGTFYHSNRIEEGVSSLLPEYGLVVDKLLAGGVIYLPTLPTGHPSTINPILLEECKTLPSAISPPSPHVKAYSNNIRPYSCTEPRARTRGQLPVKLTEDHCLTSVSNPVLLSHWLGLFLAAVGSDPGYLDVTSLMGGSGRGEYEDSPLAQFLGWIDETSVLVISNYRLLQAGRTSSLMVLGALTRFLADDGTLWVISDCDPLAIHARDPLEIPVLSMIQELPRYELGHL
jgi:hypothetical protein